MVSRVNLRINHVQVDEIMQLADEIGGLRNGRFCKDVVKTNGGDDEFVVIVKPATLPEIKEALWVILRIVKPERIAIET